MTYIVPVSAVTTRIRPCQGRGGVEIGRRSGREEVV